MKRLFLLLIFSLIGVVANPTILIANKIESLNTPEFNAVETIIEEKTPEILPVVKQEPVANLASSKTEYVAPAPVVPSNNIAIAGRYVPLIQTGNTETVFDSAASRFGEKFIYGHNSNAVFGALYGAYPGQGFSVTMNGVTRNYIVSEIVVYEKNQSNGLLQINGHGNYMNSVAAGIKKNIDEATGQVDLKYYNLAIMTCYGTMLGGGDATHRLVLFAYEI